MAEEKKLTDELEKGPWPSYVKEMKRAAKKSAAAKDLLGVQGLSALEFQNIGHPT